jgi:hypothetical protein
MTDQGQKSDNVIHFQCDHCRISLTVDDSLAGISGPCPSCGQDITAPLMPEKEVSNMVPDRPGEARKSSDIQIKGRGPARNEGFGRRPGRSNQRGRPIGPEAGISESHRERSEVSVVVKMLVTVLIVLTIVLGVAYWLNQRFNS